MLPSSQAMMPLIVGGAVATAFVAAIVATRVMSVHKHTEVALDPLVQRVFAELPGQNCGACGNANCLEAARGIASGALGSDTCLAGNGQTHARVAEALAAGELVGSGQVAVPGN